MTVRFSMDRRRGWKWWLLRVGLAVVSLSLPVLALASPQTAICVASSWVGQPISDDARVRASASTGQPASSVFNELVADGRDRIENTLWSLSSSPEILFLDGEKVFGLLGYNTYGSAVTLPHKTCLLIGADGANVDVVSHELVHADIAERLGYWNYLNLPAWVNEGIAMQVDWRTRYDVDVDVDEHGTEPDTVTTKVGSEFYEGDTIVVVRNYAAAKSLVGDMRNEGGVDRLLQLMTRRH